MKEMSIDEVVLVAGGMADEIHCGGGTGVTLQLTGSDYHDDGAKCDPVN